MPGFVPAFLGVLAAGIAWAASPPGDVVTGESSIQIKQVEAFSKLDFILPDGQLSSRIGARRGATGIGLTTFYDFPKGEISYEARFSVGSGRWTTGISGFDRVQFERILQRKRFIGRQQGAAFDVGRDLGRSYLVRLILAGQQNRLIQLVEETTDPGQDYSRQNTAALSLVKDRLGNEEPPAQGYRYEFRTTQGVRQFGGDFEYNKIEFNDFHRFKTGFQHVFSLRGGSPAYKFKYPLFERFNLGGWDSMRGYGAYEFEGEKVAWAREEWQIPFLTFSGRWWIFAPKSLSLLTSIEAGRAGDEDPDFFLSRYYSASACWGTTFQWSFRDRIPIRLTFAWGKALEKRKGVFYFRYRIR